MGHMGRTDGLDRWVTWVRQMGQIDGSDRGVSQMGQPDGLRGNAWVASGEGE